MVQSVLLSLHPSICPSVCHIFFTMFPSSYHHEISRSYYHWQKWCPWKRSRSEVKGQGQISQNKFCPILSVSRLHLQFQLTDCYEIMHKARRGIEEVPYCFSRSSVKFQGHARQKNSDFYPNWGYSDCNLSLNSPMAMKWGTKPIIFQGHQISRSHGLKNHWFWP